MSTFRVLWRRDSVLKSGTAHSKPQQALDKPGRLVRHHAAQHLHRQAGLDRGITVVGLAATLAGRCGCPRHGRIEPDRQRAAALERFGVGRPVPGLVGPCA